MNKCMTAEGASKDAPKMEVLDHGFVRLVDRMGGDLSVVRSARVSYAAEWRSGEDQGSDRRLINYLWRNKHTSPFESVSFTFDVKCPLFVARQWHRHRTWKFNEVSGRYTQLPAEFYVPSPDVIGTQSSNNKQARVLGVTNVEASETIRAACEASFDHYRRLLQSGVPRELARGVLPLNTYTHFFASVDLHNLLHFLTLRLGEHSQYEIRVYAKALLDLIRPSVPISIEAWETDKAATKGA